MQKNQIKFLVLHCSDVSEKTIFDQFQSINTYHRDVRGFPMSSKGLYVGYHYLITGNKVYQCRLDTDEGAHCNQGFDGVNIYQPDTAPYPANAPSMNFQSIGICWAGDGDTEYPSPTHFTLLRQKVWDIQAKYNIPNEHVYFHRKFNLAKTCPGSLLTQAWLDNLLTHPQPQPKPTPQVQNQTEIIAIQAAQISVFQRVIQQVINLLKALLP